MRKLVFYFGSEIELGVVAWAATACFSLTLLLLILVLVLRADRLMKERRRRKLFSVWQPLLLSSIEVASSDVPRLSRRDLPNFLLLWNHLHESVLDESKDHLNQIARALNIGDAALRMLRSRNLRERLLAIMTLGHLRERAAWDSLFDVSESGGALLSVAAARALVSIDPVKAVPRLIPLLIKRDDWPASRVATMLQAAGADLISDQIAAAAITYASDPANDSLVSHRAARLIRYLELTHSTSSLPAARKIAESSHDPEVLAACLRLLESSEDLPLVRHSVAHEDWRVRVQAATALGRVGEDNDERLLVPLLSDKQWWVRYRAAQALTHLPSMGEQRLRKIQEGLSDPFARDILIQAMAEVALQ